MSPEAYWKTLQGLLVGDAWDVLPSVQVPTQLIAAVHDMIVPLSDMEQMRRALPHAQWLLVTDAGHAGLVEAGSRDRRRGPLLPGGAGDRARLHGPMISPGFSRRRHAISTGCESSPGT